MTHSRTWTLETGLFAIVFIFCNFPKLPDICSILSIFDMS